MILGRGTAETYQAIIAEYDRFLHDTCQVKTLTVLQRLHDAPRIMRRRIGNRSLSGPMGISLTCMKTGRKQLGPHTTHLWHSYSSVATITPLLSSLPRCPPISAATIHRPSRPTGRGSRRLKGNFVTSLLASDPS